MNIRHLRYFATLARLRHYGRAAEACHITQPTLSGAIRQLESEIGLPLIRRQGSRMAGLTEAGERVLASAQRILAEQDSLSQQLTTLHSALSGDLRLGAIPAAMAMVPRLTTTFRERHGGVAIRIVSLTSLEIGHGLGAGELDAGITYLDNEPMSGVLGLPLGTERLVLVTAAEGPWIDERRARWRDAIHLPLCLLTADMQNRRIIDAQFERAGAGRPKAAIETNTILALLTHVRHGGWSTILPRSFTHLFGDETDHMAGVKTFPLVEPEARERIGLVVAERQPHAPVVEALLRTARTLVEDGA